jgi:heavy metal translocating P-type ATPase
VEARAHIRVGGLFCSFCSDSIYKALTKLEGVIDVKVSLAYEEVLVKYDASKVSETDIREVLRKMGYTPREIRRGRGPHEYITELSREKRRLMATAILTGLSASLMVLMWLGIRIQLFIWIMMLLALITIFVPGGYILGMAYQSLKRGILNQHVLLEFAAFAGLIGGILGIVNPVFPAMDFLAVSVFVTAYHILSGYTSLLVRVRANRAVDKLLSMQPETAVRIIDGTEEVVDVDMLRIGDVVKVYPGDRIPIDGVIIRGETSVDESIVTGESLPLDKGVEDEVIGGSLNLTGSILIKVTRVGDDVFIRQVAKYVEEAKVMKPGVMQLVDKVLRYYVPWVVLTALLGFVIWTVGLYIVTSHIDVVKAGYVVLAVLVMGYPCALGMATPLAMVRGGGLAAERGILFRSPDAFNVSKDIRKILFDKTGTVTYGKITVTDIVALEEDEDTVIYYAGSAELGSEHPIGRAIVKYAGYKEIGLSEPSEFRAVHGEGVFAVIDGKDVYVGSTNFLRRNNVRIDDAQSYIEKLLGQGKTVVGVAIEGRLIGLIGVSDIIREDAVEIMSRLREKGIEPIMVTGDRVEAARYIASKVGINEVYAEVLPRRKAELVEMLQSMGYRVAMVGDGINDAPALTHADVGIAMGTGTDIAIESADIIIISDNLARILDAIDISRSTYRKGVENLSIAFSINGIGVPLALTGLVHPVWAMIAMGISVSGILLNSFVSRILRRVEPGEAKAIKLYIPNLHCENCLRKVKVEIEKAFPGIILEGDIDRKIIWITYYDKAISEEQIVKILSNIGYPPTKYN